MRPSSISRTIRDSDILTAHVTASGLVTEKPCRVLSCIVASSFPATMFVILYDGVGVTWPIKLVTYFPAYTGNVQVYEQPVMFEDGLYCQVGILTTAFIQYVPEFRR